MVLIKPPSPHLLYLVIAELFFRFPRAMTRRHCQKKAGSIATVLRPPIIFSFWPHRIADKLSSTACCWILTNKSLVTARPNTVLRRNLPNKVPRTGERFDCDATSYRPGNGTGDCLVFLHTDIHSSTGWNVLGAVKLQVVMPFLNRARQRMDRVTKNQKRWLWYDLRL